MSVKSFWKGKCKEKEKLRVRHNGKAPIEFPTPNLQLPDPKIKPWVKNNESEKTKEY